jgi:arylsulfatase A-like enzyme
MLSRKPARTGRPNVIVFFTDQQRWDASGLHGNPLDLMPNFDRAAQRGTHLYHSFTCQPVCGPARACLQTGMYQNVTGAFRNDALPPVGTPMLGNYFADAGYRTGYIGKWHLSDKGVGGVPRERRGGYDYWLASNVLEMTSDAYRTRLFDNDQQSIDLPGYRVDAVADAMIRYVDKNQSDPFFLFTSFIEPHHQNHRDDYPAPEGYRERYTGRWTPPDLQGLAGSSAQHLGGYWGMIKRLDEAFGRVLDCLISLGLYENTVVLFTSDHGNSFKTRNSEYKRSCHESAIRVPTMLCGGPFEGGGQVRKLVSLIDLPPTLLDAAGIPIPPSMQGHSILPILRPNAADWQSEVFIQISESEVGRAIRTSRWKYGVTAPGKNGSSDPAADRYVETSLYDLDADPYELNNLVGIESHRELSDALKARLVKRMTAAGENAPIVEDAKPREAGQYMVYADEIDQ